MTIESPVLLRLGPVPFWRGTKKCLPELDLVYRRARVAAERLMSTSVPIEQSSKGKAVAK